MKPTLPSGEDMAAFAARRLRRQQEEKTRRSAFQNRFRWILLVFAALLLAALLADLKNIARGLGSRNRGGQTSHRGDAADIAAGMDDPRYVDPSGLFSLVPPRNWVKLGDSANPFYNATFQGPYGMDLCIQVVKTNGPTFEGLIDKLKQVERNLSADTHMDVVYVGPHRAVKRSVQLFRNRVLLLDFLTGDLAHHVQFSAPTDLYERYEPLFLRLMETYEAGRILPVSEASASP